MAPFFRTRCSTAMWPKNEWLSSHENLPPHIPHSAQCRVIIKKTNLSFRQLNKKQSLTPTLNLKQACLKRSVAACLDSQSRRTHHFCVPRCSSTGRLPAGKNVLETSRPTCIRTRPTYCVAVGYQLIHHHYAHQRKMTNCNSGAWQSQPPTNSRRSLRRRLRLLQPTMLTRQVRNVPLRSRYLRNILLHC